MEHRAGRVQLIEQLEDERGQLMGEDNKLNASLQPFHGEIQEALDTLTGLDERMKEMIFKAQLQLTNSMAFTPKFINLAENAASKYYSNSRVLDIMR